MLDLITLPFRLVFSLIGGIFRFLIGLLGIFGYILSFLFSLASLVFLVFLIYIIWRVIQRRRS